MGASAGGPNPGRRRRSDAMRNERSLLDAAARVFIRSGVEAPVREVAAEAGVGIATIYRHFPTRADLVVAVFRHQVDALAAEDFDGGPHASEPFAALRAWAGRFADFLVTKHGLAEALHSDEAGFEKLHTEFVARLLPVMGGLLDRAIAAGEIANRTEPLDLLMAIGNLCIGAEANPNYRARTMIDLLLAGLRLPLK